MAYTKKTWTKGEIIKATDLNHMEDGIEEAAQTGAQPYAPVLYMDFVDDFIPEEEDRVLVYWPEDSEAAPIVDADAISDIMLNRAVKWNIQYDERVLAIEQTNFTQVSEGVVGITEIKCSDGNILTRNSNNHFVISVSSGLACLNHQHFGTCLALINNNDGTIVSARAVDVMKHINDVNNRWTVVYASSMAIQVINTLQYHQDEEFPTIIIGNGDMFDIDSIDQDWVFILNDGQEPQYEVKEITSGNRTYLMAAFDNINDLPTPTPCVLQTSGYYSDASSTTTAGLMMDGGYSPAINGAILKVNGEDIVDFNPGALDISYALCEFNESMNQPIGGANPNTWLTESKTLKSTTAYIGIHFKVNSGEMTDAIRSQLLSTIEIVAK